MQKVLEKDLSQINRYFQEKEFVLLAYLFGSQVGGRIGPLSDCDIGIYLSQEISFDAKYYMEVDLRKILNIQAVDLVIMNKAPLALNYNIICGKCIYSVEPAIRVEYEATILSQFFDFLPFLNFHYQNSLSSSRNEKQIQRNRSALRKTEKLLAEIRTV
ncbi:MAG: nucleotidyltransferase domain-containing protein [candidate division KSB1 bacterium]|nr:nucleotidyltransferase domain-containing protein [candidate division KSB1 bacterium]MDZ7355961.1 nucleotidyltransferase domain-containing protein [candidate division KSB1 bacterium]MDZ7400705.1 nucleotidyltransferase domain-containing protein [candidate division KSB1 bacterium]